METRGGILFTGKVTSRGSRSYGSDWHGIVRLAGVDPGMVEKLCPLNVAEFSRGILRTAYDGSFRLFSLGDQLKRLVAWIQAEGRPRCSSRHFLWPDLRILPPLPLR